MRDALCADPGGCTGSDPHNLLNHLTIDPPESQQTGLNRYLYIGKGDAQFDWIPASAGMTAWERRRYPDYLAPTIRISRVRGRNCATTRTV